MASALCSRLGRGSIVSHYGRGSPGLPNLCCETDHLCEKKLGSTSMSIEIWTAGRRREIHSLIEAGHSLLAAAGLHFVSRRPAGGQLHCRLS